MYEILSEYNDEENAQTDLYQYYQDNPLDINTADKRELLIFPFLSVKDADNLLAVRPFRYKREVKAILGKTKYNLFRPFFYVKRKKKRHFVTFSQKNYIPLQKVKGIRSGKYTGSNFDNTTSVIINPSDNLRGGFLVQKDIGERSLTDHYAGSVEWQIPEYNTRFIIGKFQVRTGHGLIFSSPFGTMKSALSLSPLKFRSYGARMYMSTNENNGFSGIYCDKKFHHFSSGMFYTNTLRDAVYDDSDKYITGFDLSGYHRSENELNKSNLIRENVYGGFLQFDYDKKIIAGVSASRVLYTPDIEYSNKSVSENELRRNRFRFSGNTIEIFSAYINCRSDLINLSGELALTDPGNFAATISAFYQHDKAGFGIKWWHVPSNFQSPFGKIMSGRGAFPRAEQGVYLGLQKKFTDNLKSAVYYQSTKSLWRTYFNPMPVRDKEFFININYEINSQTEILFRYKNDNKFCYKSDMHYAQSQIKHILRFQIDKKIDKNIRLRSRIEKTIVESNTESGQKQGMNIYQDVRWKTESDIVLTFRYSSFYTDAYDARIYEYENDIPGAFSTYALSGKGYKWYIKAQYNLNKSKSIYCKYRFIYYDGVKEIGSGDNMIRGDNKQEIRVMLKISI